MEFALDERINLYTNSFPISETSSGEGVLPGNSIWPKVKTVSVSQLMPRGCIAESGGRRVDDAELGKAPKQAQFFPLPISVSSSRLQFQKSPLHTQPSPHPLCEVSLVATVSWRPRTAFLGGHSSPPYTHSPPIARARGALQRRWWNPWVTGWRFTDHGSVWALYAEGFPCPPHHPYPFCWVSCSSSFLASREFHEGASCLHTSTREHPLTSCSCPCSCGLAGRGALAEGGRGSPCQSAPPPSLMQGFLLLLLPGPAPW